MGLGHLAGQRGTVGRRYPISGFTRPKLVVCEEVFAPGPTDNFFYYSVTPTSYLTPNALSGLSRNVTELSPGNFNIAPL